MAGKQSKVRKPEAFGKGKVTPNQIAFIVDRYLCDNNFSSTRSTFRIEASSLISNSPIHEVSLHPIFFSELYVFVSSSSLWFLFFFMQI